MPLHGAVTVDPLADTLKLSLPTGTERFVPRDAYKALVKFALGLMPESELSRWSHLLLWLRDDAVMRGNAPCLVGLSFGSLGNAPAVASAALIKKIASAPPGPEMLFIMSIGSVCFQIILKPDLEAGNCDLVECSSIAWSNVIGPPGRELRIDYGKPTQMDWSAKSLMRSPIEAIHTHINPKTEQGQITLTLRPTEGSLDS